MDSDTIWHHIDTERTALCDILETLTDEQWRQPSLCEAWTVRDVAAHIAFAQVRLREVLVPWLRAGLNNNRMIRDLARQSPLDRAQIIHTIRGFVGSRRCPPFVSEKEPLADILVHTQDICLPLGIDHTMPLDAAVTSIERLIQINRTPLRLRRPLHDVRLVATDVDWAHGQGRLVEGPLQWLLLTVAGRDVAHQHLSCDVAATKPTPRRTR